MKRLLTLIFLIASSVLFSQGEDRLNVVDDRDMVAQPENYVRFSYDNDLFAFTDRYYTQGVRLDLIHPLARRSPLSHCLARLPGADMNYYGLHLQQDVFTPRDITYMNGAIYDGERPYSAVFFLSHANTSIRTEKKTLLYTQLDLGIIGPAALGAEEQKTIHRLTDNPQPLGWQNQLPNDLVLNYRARLEKCFINTRGFAFTGYGSARLGTLYTDAGLGLKLQAGLLNSWHNYGASRRLRLYVQAIAGSKLVAYNATLQGGLFNQSKPYRLSDAAINRNVNELSVGITFGYGAFGFSISRHYLSPEFGGGLPHGWGGGELSLRF